MPARPALRRRPGARPARTRCAIALAAHALLACGAPAPGTSPAPGPAAAGERARVVVVSIDGLMPETYLDPDALGLAVPTLRALAARGAAARAVEPVFPSVTYPAHTTLVTGAWPRAHGITANRSVDPLLRNQGGWRWYAEDIAVPTLWQAVEAQGRAAALVQWPVTAGARVTFNVPEYWRAGTPDDQKLLRSLSTPGLLERVARDYPALWTELVPPDVRDPAQLAIARYLVTEEDPDLVLVHAWQVDDAQHAHGPRSPQAREAIERADALLGELLAALERSPAWPRTTLVVLSDHGFAPVERELRLNALLAARGLITVGPDGKVTAARVATLENGGSAYVYLVDPSARAELLAALAGPELAGAIARTLAPAELAALGGDPDAALALVAAPGYVFSDALAGPPVGPARGRGHHGFAPTDPAMAASFIAVGPRVAPRDLGAIRMIDIAPTLARWLGVALPGAAGRPIAALVGG